MIPVNEVIPGNCAEVMAGWPDGCIDLAVTSPPYDNLRDYEGYEFDFEAIAAQLWRITKPGGAVVWVVADGTENGSRTGSNMRQALHFMELGFNLHQELFYEKAGPPPDPTRYEETIEKMFAFSKGKPKSINLLKDKPNRWAGVRQFGQKSTREKDGSLTKKKAQVIAQFGKRTSVWRYATGAGYSTKDSYAFEHPAIFPEALASDHILSWSNPGDIVLDPMCGSGTTLKMAKQTGRQFIGIDISEKYCAIARKRVEGAQPPLFLETVTPANNGRTLTGATAPEGKQADFMSQFTSKPSSGK